MFLCVRLSYVSLTVTPNSTMPRRRATIRSVRMCDKLGTTQQRLRHKSSMPTATKKTDMILKSQEERKFYAWDGSELNTVS